MHQVLSTPATVLCPHCGQFFRTEPEQMSPSHLRTDSKGRRYREEVSDSGIIYNEAGDVVFNAMQMDDMLVRRRYENGVITLTSKRDGRYIVPPYRVDDHGEMSPASDWSDAG